MCMDSIIRITVRDPLGLKTGIIVDNMSAKVDKGRRSVRIYGRMRSTESTSVGLSEPEIYFCFLNASRQVLYVGRGKHFGNFRINRSVAFAIELLDRESELPFEETVEIEVYVAF